MSRTFKHLRVSSDCFRLPQSDTRIEYPVPTESIRYVPEYPKPPTGDSDPDGLRKRIDYAEGIRKRRDISGRLLAFISKYKDQCSRALRLQKKSREELLNTIKIDEGELWSRWEEVHGSDGIIVAFRNSTAAMMEMRLVIEYGDVLGEACKQLKSSLMNNLSLEWKAHPEMDWMAVVTAIRADIEKINAYRASCDRGDEPKEYPKVSWWRSCEEAASKLGTTPDQIEWEITHYAKRNSLCHQGIGDMIARCQWESLGKQLLDDKLKLGRLFEGRMDQRIHMETCLDRIIDLYFEDLYYDNNAALWSNETQYAKDKKKALWDRMNSKEHRGSKASSVSKGSAAEPESAPETITPTEDEGEEWLSLTIALGVEKESW